MTKIQDVDPDEFFERATERAQNILRFVTQVVAQVAEPAEFTDREMTAFACGIAAGITAAIEELAEKEVFGE